jgi:regulatory protein
LDELAERQGDAELAAAAAFARKRRIGPWRSPAERADRREKDLAAMARAGFAYRVVRLVMDADDPAEVEALLAGEGQG